ncbi:MAG: PQQ-binding-like beta-propeller repeat protein [Deltaproteobacteria bacterium]|nr:PQQ-binding-like beta-propeller repeat protein [Deltaproteobacteria bacterium]
MLRDAALVALVVLVAACGARSVGRGDAIDPLGPGRDQQPAVEVLSFSWKKVVHDRSSDYKPQEFASVAATEKALYVGTHDGMFYALNPTDGAVFWKQPTGQVSSRALVDLPRIYVGTDEGTLVALDMSGRVLWRHAAKGSILHPPVVVGDMLVFSDDADHVTALDRETGNWRWGYERETPEEFTMRGHAGAFSDGERVFAGFSDGYLVALQASSGEAMWIHSLAGDEKRFVDVDTTPVLAGNLLLAASAAGGVHAVDPRDGAEKWRVPAKGVTGLSAGTDRIYLAAAEEGLLALDLRGNLLWRQGLKGAGDPATPQVVGPYLFLSTADRGLFIVDRNTGDLMQSFDPGPGVSAPPTVFGNRVYVLSNGGVLYSMSLHLP